MQSSSTNQQKKSPLNVCFFLKRLNVCFATNRWLFAQKRRSPERSPDTQTQHGAHVPPPRPTYRRPHGTLGGSQPSDPPADGPDAPPIRTLGFIAIQRDSPPGPLLPCPPCRARASVAAALAGGRCPFLDPFASSGYKSSRPPWPDLASSPPAPRLAVA